VNLNKLRAHVEILQMVKRKKADLKKLEDNSKAEIQKAMGSEEIGELDGKVVIRWSRFKKRQLNQSKLREDNPELAEEYTDLVEQRQFNVVDE